MDNIINDKYIPDGTKVYKKTGNTEFVIRENLKIFTYDTANGKGSDGSRQVIAQEGVKYMIGERGDINMVTGDTILRIDLSQNPDEGDINIDLLEMILDRKSVV